MCNARYGRYITAFAVAALLLYIPLNVLLDLLNIASGPRLTDFDTYYYSARRLLDGGSLYADTVAPNGSSRRFMYPPVAILLFLPFAFLPFTAAGITWNVFSVLVLAAGVTKLLTELAADADFALTKSRYLLVLACVVGFAPTVNWIKAGQATGVVVGGLCLSVASLLQARRTTSSSPGICASLLIPVVCSVKPYYAPSGAHLLQDSRRLGYAVLSGVTVAILGVLALGVDVHQQYLDVVLTGQSNLVFPVPPSQWNASIYSPLYPLGDFAVAVRIALILATIAAVVVAAYYQYRPIELALLGIAIIPVATPTRVDGLTALIPVYLVLLLRYWERPSLRTATLVSILAVHVHPYTIELLAKIGPQYVPTLEIVTPFVPFLQPALWGHLLLLFVLSFVIFQRAPHSRHQ